MTTDHELLSFLILPCMLSDGCVKLEHVQTGLWLAVQPGWCDAPTLAVRRGYDTPMVRLGYRIVHEYRS